MGRLDRAGFRGIRYFFNKTISAIGTGIEEYDKKTYSNDNSGK